MEIFLKFFKFFVIAFFSLMVIGFFNASTKDYSQEIQLLIQDGLILSESKDDIFIVAYCDKNPEAAFSIASRAILTSADERLKERGGFEPAYHKEVAAAFLGGSSAGLTIKSLTRSRDGRFWIAAGIALGTISGYLIGDRIGEMVALRCGGKKRNDVLHDKKSWETFAQIQYGHILATLGLRQDMEEGRFLVHLKEDGEKLFQREASMEGIQDAVKKSFSSESAERSLKKSGMTLNGPPLYIRCPSSYSAELEGALKNSLNNDFQPKLEDFRRLYQIRSRYKATDASTYQLESDRLWSEWVGNGLTEEQFKLGGGISGLLEIATDHPSWHSPFDVSRFSFMRPRKNDAGDVINFSGPDWELRAKALNNLRYHIFYTDKLGPESSEAFRRLCDKMLATGGSATLMAPRVKP